MKRTVITIMLLLMIIWFSPVDSYGDSELLSSTKYWEPTKISDYPEVVVKGSPNNEPILMWTPDIYLGTGELSQKWVQEIPYVYELKFHNFNNIPEGWLYITADKKPESEKDTAIFRNHYVNRLINPENGDVTELMPKFSMYSHIRTNTKICDSPYTYDDLGRVKDIRCYDIGKSKLRWHIRDKRRGQSLVKPYLPILETKGQFFYMNNGITSFDDKTGEIDWSFDFKKMQSNALYTHPFIKYMLISNNYLWLLDSPNNEIQEAENPWGSNGRESKLYRINSNSKKIAECKIYHLTANRFLADPEYLWLTKNKSYENYSELEQYNPNTIEKLDRIDVLDLFYDFNLDAIENEDTCIIYHPTIGNYTPITIYNNGCWGILESVVTYDWYGGENIVSPYYDCDTFQFLLDRDNPNKLIEIGPVHIDNKRTHLQVVDNELIIQTFDTITCYNPKTLKEKWSIDKSNFKNPKEATVYAVDWRGVLIRDFTDDNIAILYCYDTTNKPVPEPTPEPVPEPEPLPVEEKIILKFTIDVKEYSLDGAKRPIDVAPIILNGRTLLPARFVTEPLGGDVSWNASDKSIICKLGENMVEFWIGKPIAKVNGVEVQIDPNNLEVCPIIIDDRTMVPMRFLAESLECSVEWIATTKEIQLTYTP